MNPYAGSIGELLANAGRIKAQRIRTAANLAAAQQARLAEIAGDSVLQRSQSGFNPFEALAGSLGDYLRAKRFDTPVKTTATAGTGYPLQPSIAPERAYTGQATFDQLYRIGALNPTTVPY